RCWPAWPYTPRGMPPCLRCCSRPERQGSTSGQAASGPTGQGASVLGVRILEVADLAVESGLRVGLRRPVLRIRPLLPANRGAFPFQLFWRPVVVGGVHAPFLHLGGPRLRPCA